MFCFLKIRAKAKNIKFINCIALHFFPFSLSLTSDRHSTLYITFHLVLTLWPLLSTTSCSCPDFIECNQILTSIIDFALSIFNLFVTLNLIFEKVAGMPIYDSFEYFKPKLSSKYFVVLLHCVIVLDLAKK